MATPAECALKWIAENRIERLDEYVEVVKHGGVPADGKLQVLYLALRCSWAKKAAHGGRGVYTLEVPAAPRAVGPEEVRAIAQALDGRFVGVAGKHLDDAQVADVACVLDLLFGTDDYAMLAENRLVNAAHMRKAFGIIASALSFLRYASREALFRVLFLLCANIGGFFLEGDSQRLEDEDEFSFFLVFVQTLANTNGAKFLAFLDVLCILDQKTLARLVLGVIKKEITPVSLTDLNLLRFAQAAAAQLKQHKLAAGATEVALVEAHGAAAKDAEELAAENRLLKQNIEVLHADIRYFGEAGVISALKAVLRDREEPGRRGGDAAGKEGGEKGRGEKDRSEGDKGEKDKGEKDRSAKEKSAREKSEKETKEG